MTVAGLPPITILLSSTKSFQLALYGVGGARERVAAVAALVLAAFTSSS